MKNGTKRFVRCIGFITLSLFAGLAYGITSGAGEATLTIQNSWSNGYCANVNIANNGTTNITNWTVELTLNNATINNLWNGTLNEATVTPTDSNATIQSGSSVTFGFCASTTDDTVVSPTLASLTVVGGSSESSDTEDSDDSASSSDDSVSSDDSGTTVEYDPIQTGCSGYTTRYWDCCKPHCGWTENVPDGMSALQSCTISNDVISDFSTQSSCDGGDAYTCLNMIPYAVSDTLAYGYAATSSGSDVCGRCYQLQFTGESYNSSGDPGSAALEGKTMIVQAINIGYDVSGGQFDLLVPGGGVGAYNACTTQWGIPASELGSQYGGLLNACKQELGWDASLEEYKSCLTESCNSVFGSRDMTEMLKGCLWYADWFEAADNPALKYKEVACPAELTLNSGMDRSALNDISTACGD
jgi:hypothetical protein